ncbi:unnamed protein product [Paramecium pentaurelia]|uniref:Uncharacterized protein n=1 Tax=Paramecium pentaurelia TaxID=43138 RepID=A0A8S1V1L0_9CILI|nr:unnamed protein product [Paramecium pentaurelia]
MVIESEVLQTLYELYKRDLISYAQKGLIKAKMLCFYLVLRNAIVSLVYRIELWKCQENRNHPLIQHPQAQLKEFRIVNSVDRDLKVLFKTTIKIIHINDLDQIHLQPVEINNITLVSDNNYINIYYKQNFIVNSGKAMGICGNSSLKSHPSDNIIEQNKEKNGLQYQLSKTVKLFDYNQNKIVQVPVLNPATQNTLYFKRQAQSPSKNHDTVQQITQS